MTVRRILEMLARIFLLVLSPLVFFIIFYFTLIFSSGVYDGYRGPYKVRAQILNKGDDFVEVKILSHSILIDAYVLTWEKWGQQAKTKIVIGGPFDKFKVSEIVLIVGNAANAGTLGLENKYEYYERVIKATAVSKDRFDPLGADIALTLVLASGAFPLTMIPVIFPRRKVLNKTRG